MTALPFETAVARLRTRLNQPLPGLAKCMEMAPQNPSHMNVARAREKGCREGAVLILLYPHANTTYTVLTVRNANLRSHAGQISLPGGRLDAGETAATAAVRELEEELAVPAASVEVIGALTEVYIPPSNYCLAPIVAISSTRPDFRASEAEVDIILEIPADFFIDPDNRQVELWQIENEERRIPFFLFSEHKIWGATAIVMSEFSALWEEVVANQ